jgi:6,7-dimethyl-8-ribityllumazine synthase
MAERSVRPADPSELDASELRVAIICSRFNADITDRLLDGARRFLSGHGGRRPLVVWVPGCFELPLTAATLAESGQVDAIVALGCVIQGETSHHQHVAGECASGLMHVNLDTGVPVGFGVLTVSDPQQALDRSEPDNNRGADAAEAAVVMANVVRRLQEGGDEPIQIKPLTR